LHVGDAIGIAQQDSVRKTMVTHIERFRRPIDQANTGDIVGVLLQSIDKDHVQRGDILTGTIPDSAIPSCSYTGTGILRSEPGS
jgi:elongation factor Tu